MLFWPSGPPYKTLQDEGSHWIQSLKLPWEEISLKDIKVIKHENTTHQCSLHCKRRCCNLHFNSVFFFFFFLNLILFQHSKQTSVITSMFSYWNEAAEAAIRSSKSILGNKTKIWNKWVLTRCSSTESYPKDRIKRDATFSFCNQITSTAFSRGRLD